jgi:hypothetical protein
MEGLFALTQVPITHGDNEMGNKYVFLFFLFFYY